MLASALASKELAASGLRLLLREQMPPDMRRALNEANEAERDCE